MCPDDYFLKNILSKYLQIFKQMHSRGSKYCKHGIYFTKFYAFNDAVSVSFYIKERYLSVDWPTKAVCNVHYTVTGFWSQMWAWLYVMPTEMRISKCVDKLVIIDVYIRRLTSGMEFIIKTCVNKRPKYSRYLRRSILILQWAFFVYFYLRKILA